MEGLLKSIPTPPALSKPVEIISKFIGIALPIAEVSIGAVFLYDCPKQPYIPIYLLVSGVFTLVLDVVAWCPCLKILKCVCALYVWYLLVGLFLFCWFIAGSVWIYSVYPPDYTGTDYCDKTLYLFAFWTTTVVYILLAIALPVSYYKEYKEEESDGNVVNV